MKLTWIIAGILTSLSIALLMLLAVIFDNIHFAFLCGAGAQAVLMLFLTDLVDNRSDDE